MASNSGFTTTLPSATSSAALGDDEFRSVKSFMKAWWEDEHYALDGSATSAGEHKVGSARAYQAAGSARSNPRIGALFHDTDDDSMWVASGSTYVRVTSATNLDSVNTWTQQQSYTSTVKIGSSGAPIYSITTHEVVFPATTINGGDSFNSLLGSISSEGDVAFINAVNPYASQVIFTVQSVDDPPNGVKAMASNLSSAALSSSTYTCIVTLLRLTG